MKKTVLIFSFIFSVAATSVAQTQINNSFFDQVESFLQKNVNNGLVNYAQLKNDAQVNQFVDLVENAQINNLDANSLQAFYINAYNLLVIKNAADLYPISSINSQPGFFDKKQLIAGKKASLNQIEKEFLLKEYKDPRFHFVLVCGALGCPPITDFVYRPAQLNEQLDQQTKKALNNPIFIKLNQADKKVELSQIFEWYSSDFGGSKKAAVQFINQYRQQTIPENFSINFYTYDWNLNETSGQGANSNNASRYVVSAAIVKGSTETKWFNNLYTQKTGNGGELTDRANFFTSSLSFLYGINNKFNLGFDLRYRQVSYESLPSSPLDVFTFEDTPTTRQGITGVGPKIRYAPFESLPNFSVQSAWWFPTSNDLAGSSTRPYIDWNGSSWFTQVFNDFPLGGNFSLFTEVDIFLEDIGASEDGHINRFSTPITTIFSYFPNPKTTLYALGSFSPYWQADFDYFTQAGLGAKYQFTPNIEVELLYTSFSNKFLKEVNGQASTFNIGLRLTK